MKFIYRFLANSHLEKRVADKIFRVILQYLPDLTTGRQGGLQPLLNNDVILSANRGTVTKLADFSILQFFS
ncbi:MAG: hypothetical protein ABIG61_15325 [Planctomycetota bacterium]